MVAVNLYYTKKYNFGYVALMPFHPKINLVEMTCNHWSKQFEGASMKYAVSTWYQFDPKKLGKNVCFLVETDKVENVLGRIDYNPFQSFTFLLRSSLISGQL